MNVLSLPAILLLKEFRSKLQNNLFLVREKYAAKQKSDLESLF